MALAEVLPELERDPDLKQSRGDLSQARHLPGYIYHSPEIFELEKEKIFMIDWLAMARVEEFEKSGDYRTFRVMGEPVIICRDPDGAINAFANVCAHRGVEVASGQGNLGEFSCPYHGWLYDLQGKLIGAPYMKEAEGFDPANCRLKPLRSGTWAGWIFISFDDGAPSIESHVEWFEAAFGMFRMGDCRYSGKYVTELDCNWKFVNENLMDVYHFQTLHAGTFGAYLDGEQFNIGLTDKGDVNAFYKAAPTTPNAKTLVGKMPWFGDDIGEDLGCMGFLSPQFHCFRSLRRNLAAHCRAVESEPDALHALPLVPKTTLRRTRICREGTGLLRFLDPDLGGRSRHGPSPAAQHACHTVPAGADVEAGTYRSEHH